MPHQLEYEPEPRHDCEVPDDPISLREAADILGRSISTARKYARFGARRDTKMHGEPLVSRAYFVAIANEKRERQAAKAEVTLAAAQARAERAAYRASIPPQAWEAAAMLVVLLAAKRHVEATRQGARPLPMRWSFIRDALRGVGTALANAGGIELMLAACEATRSLSPNFASSTQASLNAAWDGIGDWTA